MVQTLFKDQLELHLRDAFINRIKEKQGEFIFNIMKLICSSSKREEMIKSLDMYREWLAIAHQY